MSISDRARDLLAAELGWHADALGPKWTKEGGDRWWASPALRAITRALSSPAVGEGDEPNGAIAKSERVADANLRALREAVERRAKSPPEDEGLVELIRYHVGNPSAWSAYDDGVSELLRQAADRLSTPPHDRATLRREAFEKEGE